jgi:hypothetical protein
MTEGPEPSADSEWLTDVPSVAEPLPAEEAWPELVEPAPDPEPDREPWPEPDQPPAPDAADEDDFRRSTFEVQRARRTVDSWNDEFSERVAGLERRMAAFAHAGRSVDSRQGKPGKESS